MLVEVNGKYTFWAEDASNLESKFNDGVPILCTGSHRLCQQCGQFLFNEMGWTTYITTIKDENCPYVLVIAKKHRAKATFATARVICKAIAIGIESHYLYDIEPTARS
jgi:hypothetical protein